MLVARHQDYFESIGRAPLLQHTWSLAVEAQFYVVWPLILYFILKRFGEKLKRRIVGFRNVVDRNRFRNIEHSYV